MASRYAIKTGNWNDASVWSATSGGAGGAGVPEAGDDVFLDANYIVTLTADADCRYLFHSNGTLTCSSFNMHIVHMYSDENSSTAKTLNMGSGTWTIDYSGMGYSFWIRNSATALNPQSSTLILNGFDDNGYPLAIGNKTLNDVIVNLTGSGTNPTKISGSPTFRSLIIQSKNSAAHTVNFDDDVYVNKLVVTGASSSNKLTIENDNGKCFIFGETNTAIGETKTATTYGQFVHMNMQAVSNIFYDDPVNPTYIGSNSTTDTTGWLIQDPPKISTLVDPLTTAPGSNPNWRTTGTITQVYTGYNGGGYTIAGGASLTSTDTYDLVDSSLVFQRVGNTTGITTWKVNDGAIEGYIDGFSGQEMVMTDPYNNIDGGGVAYSLFDITSPVNKFVKISLSSSTRRLSASVSDDGVSWTEKSYYVLPTDDDLLYFRSIRLGPWTGGNYTIGAFNPTFATPSTGNFLTFFNGA